MTTYKAKATINVPGVGIILAGQEYSEETFESVKSFNKDYALETFYLDISNINNVDTLANLVGKMTKDQVKKLQDLLNKKSKEDNQKTGTEK